MTKTTFLGYVPSLKSKHEATIVNGRAMKSKGGSIRYLLEGEYDGRKTLPKTVSKEDFVKVYGFDAKEAESVVILGKNEDSDEGVMLGHAVGKEDKTGFTPTKIATGGSVALIEQTDNHQAETVVGSPSPADVEPPAPSEKPFPQEPSNENFSADYQTPAYSDESITYYDSLSKDELEAIEQEIGLSGKIAVLNHITKHKLYDESEVKEALGLFGKKEEEEKEESDEPKTQEFTVVLQEGDKLELTDIPEEKEEEVSEENEEEQAAPDDENTEKEAESPKTRTFVVSSVDYETDGEDQDELGLPQDFTFVLDIDGPFGIGDTTDMQEIADEIVDDISDETGFLVSGFYFQEKMPDGTLVDLDAETYEAVQAKVTRPVKEDETEDEEESDEEGLSTGAKVALGVGALAAGVALFGAEDDDPYENQTDYSRIYEASVNVGEKRIMSRKDYDIDNELSGFSNMDIDDIDLDDYEDEIAESVESELIDAIRESVDDNLPITDGDSGSGSVNVDTEIEISVPISGDIDYEWDANINHEDDEHDEEWDAEHESETDGYTYAYTKGHKDGMDNEVIYRPSIETDREKTIFKKILKQKADTVGNPSPSGPSSTPEPAEATGSEPSNEEFKGENRNLAIGLTAAGVGLVALLGADRIKKLFDRFNL